MRKAMVASAGQIARSVAGEASRAARLLKRPWLRIKLRFLGLVTLGKTHHSPSKADPRSLRSPPRRCPSWARDSSWPCFRSRTFAPSALCCESCSKAWRMWPTAVFKLSAPFRRYWPYDERLAQIHHFGLQIEGCIHFFRSSRCADCYLPGADSLGSHCLVACHRPRHSQPLRASLASR